ncbi:MAG: hypothetical protein RL129_1316 [Actinomycetota bacterium]|jgi:hypothetical protein
MKKILAALVAPIAVIGLSFSVTGLSVASADPSGTNETGSSVGTVPQCAWHLDGVSGTVTMSHADGSLYKGDDYSLSGTTGEIDSYVAPVSASSKPATPGVDDCSWYTTIASAEITISTSDTPEFTSESFAEDTTMDFPLNSSNKLSATVSPSCSSPWEAAGDGENDIYSGHVSGVVTSLALGDVTTVSSCSYTVAYAAKVPGGKSPTHAGSNYAMTGPTLTTTLVTSTGV